MTCPPAVRVRRLFNLLHGAPCSCRDQRPAPGRTGAADDRSGLLRAAVPSLAADVLGLQEVDVAQPRSGGRHQVRGAAAAMAAEHWRFAPSVRGTPGEHRHGARRRPTDDDARGRHRRHRYGVGLVSPAPGAAVAVDRFAAAPLSLPLLVPAEPRPRLMRVRDEPRAAIAAVVESGSGPVTVATAHLSFVPG